MGDADEEAQPGVDGEPVHCSSCDCPVVLFLVPSRGYRLVCGCPKTAMDIDPVASESSLLEPISGKWSSLDPPDTEW